MPARVPRCARTPARAWLGLARIVVGVVVILVGAGACAWNAAPPLYLKPGVELEVRKRDEVECLQKAFVNVAGPETGPSRELDRSAYDSCMKGRGYSFVKD